MVQCKLAYFSDKKGWESVPRQESESDSEEEDRALVEKTKEKKKKEKKGLVFEIKLFEDANDLYEYNYKEMMK